jgi:hypothetical protein
MTRVRARKFFVVDGYPPTETSVHGNRANEKGMIVEVPTSRVEYLLGLRSIELLPEEPKPTPPPERVAAKVTKEPPAEEPAAEPPEERPKAKPRGSGGQFVSKKPKR